VFTDLGLKGQVYIKYIKGKPYAILNGLPGSRVVLSNGRYLPSNPKLVRLGVGKLGVKAKMRSGTAFTIILYVGIDIASYILKEDSTIGELFGSIISDVSKVLISTALGTAAGMLAAGSVAAVGAIAAGPIVIAIGVAFLAGMALDALDEKYGLTQTLIKKLDEIADQISASVDEAESTFSRFLNQMEREIIWNVTGGRFLY